MRFLEAAVEDEGFKAIAQFVNLNSQKEGLTSEGDMIVKAKEEEKAKVEVLLEDNTEMKLLHKQVWTDLTKVQAIVSNIKT